MQGENIDVGKYKSRAAEEQHAAVLDRLAEVNFKKYVTTGIVRRGQILGRLGRLFRKQVSFATMQ